MMTLYTSSPRLGLLCSFCGLLLSATCTCDSEDEITRSIKILKEKSSPDRYQAALKLGALGAQAKDAVPALIAALEEDDQRVSAAAGQALVNIGAPAVQAIADRLSSAKDVKTRLLILNIFLLVGRDAKAALPALIKISNDEDRSLRLASVKALHAIKDPRAIPALTDRLLLDEDFGVRRFAAVALGCLEGKAEPAIGNLIDVLREMNELKKVDLGNIPDSLVQFPYANPVQNLEYDVRNALVNIGGPAVPRLVNLLRDADKDLRRETLGLLWCIGANAREAVPAVIKCLGDSDATVRAEAATALGGIGENTKAAGLALAKALKDKDADVRVCASTAVLNHMRADQEEALTVLLACLHVHDALAREHAARELGWLKKIRPRAVAGLRAALKDPEESVRNGVVDSLCHLANQAPAAIPALIVAVEDSSESVRMNAVHSLGELEKPGKTVLDVMIKALHDPSSKVRIVAAQKLADFGKSAESAVPALKELLIDPDRDVQEAAKDALSRLGKDEYNSRGK
jgi:HEAT repeat protein